jgi:hypothetical protein
VLTAIAEKLERGSAPVDTGQLIDELGLTRQDLTALRALDVDHLIMRWPERITYRRSDPSTLGICSRRCCGQLSLLASQSEPAGGVHWK